MNTSSKTTVVSNGTTGHTGQGYKTISGTTGVKDEQNTTQTGSGHTDISKDTTSVRKTYHLRSDGSTNGISKRETTKRSTLQHSDTSNNINNFICCFYIKAFLFFISFKLSVYIIYTKLIITIHCI